METDEIIAKALVMDYQHQVLLHVDQLHEELAGGGVTVTLTYTTAQFLGNVQLPQNAILEK